MSSIVSALSDVVSSIVELVWSFFTTAGHLVQNTAQFATKFASEIIELAINFFKGLVDLAGGIVSFVVGKAQIEGYLSMKLNTARKRHHARCPGRCLLRLPTVSTQPRPLSPGRKQEVELGLFVPGRHMVNVCYRLCSFTHSGDKMNDTPL
jgi:hypothetical protein